ncbi:MAG: glycine cleavage system protein H [Syntrophothermus sp.]
MVALFVVSTFVLFIVIDIFVLKAQRKSHPALEKTPGAVFNKSSIAHPDKVYISKGHTWAQKLQDGTVKVGVDDFALKALGRLSVTRIVPEKTKVSQGEVILEGTCSGNVFKFRSPVEGTVKAVNESILNRTLTEPFTNGWGIIITPADWEKNSRVLKTGESLSAWLKEEFRRMRDFIEVSAVKPELAGVTMHDGGNIVEGAVANIDASGMENFEQEFLTF